MKEKIRGDTLEEETKKNIKKYKHLFPTLSPKGSTPYVKYRKAQQKIECPSIKSIIHSDHKILFWNFVLIFEDYLREWREIAF